MLGNGVDFLVDNNLLPLTSLFIEPAKVIFLNNAINHGVLTPLGLDRGRRDGQVRPLPARGQPRPGPGPAPRATRSSARAWPRPRPRVRSIIQFFGGIHEIYFPYVLMKPKLILAMIAGGMTGICRQRRLRRRACVPRRLPARSSPSTRRRPAASFVGVTLAVVFGAAAVSFLVARCCSSSTGPTTRATSRPPPRRWRSTRARSPIAVLGARHRGRRAATIKTIVFACDAGMGSSAMGASVLRKKIQDAGHGDVTVVNKAIANLDDTYDLVVSHQDLTDRARQKTPSAIHVSVDNFMGSPRYDEIVELLELGRSRRGSRRPPARPRATCWTTSRSCSTARPAPVTTPSPRPASLLVASRCGRRVVRRLDARARDLGVDP